MKARTCLIVGLLVPAIGFGTAGILLAGDSGDESAAGPGPRFRGIKVPGWPTLGGDFQRTGLSAQDGPVQGGVLWTFETGGAVVGSATVNSDGRIHVACEDGKLYTLSRTGELLSVADVNTPLVSAPTIGVPGDILYVGTKDGRLLALTPDGSVQRTWQTGDAIYAAPALASNASMVASSSGDIYVGSTDGTLYALSEGGKERWRFRTKGPGDSPAGAIFASPALGAHGTIYVAGMYDPNLYALNPADGSVKWVCHFPPASEDESAGWPFASPVVAADGTIYQTLLYDRHLYAISPDTGAIRWSVDLCDPLLFGPEKAAELEGSGWSEPALGPDGTIYVGLDDPYLRAVDPSGTIKWVTQLGEVGGFTLTVDRTGLIYAACDDGHVYVVSPGSLLLAQFEIEGWPAFPVLVLDDLLIVADSRDYSGYTEGGKNAVWAISSQIPPNGPIRRP